ncbi:MAG: tetratricopeptide repeat protein [Archangium sp.]|nr:tetratricopeptide repeat protein [Archangium sp.]
MRTLCRAACAVVLSLASACAHRAASTTPAHEVRFTEMVITGDLELEKLNAEELFAAGTSFFAADDFGQAARYFGRLADFHPTSQHRRAALYNAGLALEKLKAWDDALARFTELADAKKGLGDALDAAYRVAEVLYHLERFDDAIEVLRAIADRSDLAVDKRLEARVQQGVCEVEAGRPDDAERTLRAAMAYWQEQPDKDLIDEYFPGQAQFFLGEIFRIHYESIILDGSKDTEKLAQDLEYKSELLLSAQGHYLRAIRLGNGYWATASGQRIGNLYENMYEHMVNAPAPNDLDPAEQATYRTELRKKIRVLITKAITVYERTLEAAERIGAASPFVEQTRESLRHMKDLLLAEAQAEDAPTPPPPPPAGNRPKPHS